MANEYGNPWDRVERNIRRFGKLKSDGTPCMRDIEAACKKKPAVYQEMIWVRSGYQHGLPQFTQIPKACTR